MIKLYRSSVFYPALIALWVMVLFFRYNNYRYSDNPIPTSGYELKNTGGVFSGEYLQDNLHVLKTHFLFKGKAQDLPHLLANIGAGYYDLYGEKGDRAILDTVIFYLLKSANAAPDIPRVHYNLGRAFADVADYEKALHHFGQAIALDPSHVPALTNAAMTAYFVFNRKEITARYLSQALAVDSLMPMCHLVLGLIHASENNFAEALSHFEAEIAAGQKNNGAKNMQFSSQDIHQVSVLTRFNLFTLYSQQFRDRNKALLNLHEYLRLEDDGKKKSEALAAFRKYWGTVPR